MGETVITAYMGARPARTTAWPKKKKNMPGRAVTIPNRLISFFSFFFFPLLLCPFFIFPLTPPQLPTPTLLFSSSSTMFPFDAWTPGPGPLYTAITSVWDALNLPHPSLGYRTWIPGESPLSTQKAVVAAVGTYLLVIFGGREMMKNRQPFKLKIPFQIHNVYLTLGSGLLLALMLEEIIPLFLKHGFFWSICNTSAFTPRLVTFYMINYYFKYVELIDTVFLVLKKKPLAFLHVFHHAATAVLCYTQLNGETSVQWVVITLNLTVHVIMYYYYYATAGGAKIWWKKYLTTLQITQFIIDLFIVFFASTLLFSHRYSHNQYPNLLFPISPSSTSFFFLSLHLSSFPCPLAQSLFSLLFTLFIPPPRASLFHHLVVL
ncbi:fatty acid elongase [Cryptococcus neoformans AD2-60a]|nr:fatty acid elongase [Cryptococcus neoformans var. grubii AD2-60a]OXC86184.1 fatty acid elongase [Cryptococcus neoformans var. grubii AD1-7a]OXG37784.1 fatty acid elongase [Cryptococcus neoformans var. grubii Bt15]OXH36959.1 fatty acid elongase [Cryptococcus neoformans var. grubii]